MSQKYNILICFAKLGAGGIETACITQIKEFARIGYNVFVLAEEGIYLDTLKRINGINYINFKYDSRNSFNLDKIRKVKEIIVENNIKLVYIHQVDCVSSVFSACMLTKTPYIAYVHHGITGVYDIDLEIGNMSNEFLKLYYKFAYKIINISELPKEENKKRFEIEENKYEVIPNCIDFEDFKSDKPINVNKVLMISRMEKDKGKGILNGLKFFKEYKLLNPNAELTIAGGGSQEDVVKKQIKDLDIECKMLGLINNVKEVMDENGVVLGVGRCIQEAIAMKRYAIITGNKLFQGSVNKNNISIFSNVNFSGNVFKNQNYKETAQTLYSMNREEIDKIVNENYEWLIKNRNIKNNLYEIENIENINNPLEDIDYKKVIEILFGELQYMHTWMQKEIDRGWDVRQKTEDYYLNREKWNENQMRNKDNEMQTKDIEIKELKKENEEIKNKLSEILESNSWKFIKKIRDNKIVSKIKRKNDKKYGGK